MYEEGDASDLYYNSDDDDEDEVAKIMNSKMKENQRARHWSLSKEAKRDLEHVGLPGRKDYVFPPSGIKKRERMMSTIVRGSPEIDEMKGKELRRNSEMNL